MCMDHVYRHVYGHFHGRVCRYVYGHVHKHVYRRAYGHVFINVYGLVHRYVYGHVHRYVYGHVYGHGVDMRVDVCLNMLPCYSYTASSGTRDPSSLKPGATTEQSQALLPPPHGAT